MSQIILTQELIEAGVSSKGGYNKCQLAALGIEWPPQKGWKTSVIGHTITEEDYQRFIDAKKS